MPARFEYKLLSPKSTTFASLMTRLALHWQLRLGFSVGCQHNEGTQETIKPQKTPQKMKHFSRKKTFKTNGIITNFKTDVTYPQNVSALE